MTLITNSSNALDLSMTMVAESDAAPERLWNLLEDPRKLERWWGPPLTRRRSHAASSPFTPRDHGQTWYSRATAWRNVRP